MKKIWIVQKAHHTAKILLKIQKADTQGYPNDVKAIASAIVETLCITSLLFSSALLVKNISGSIVKLIL
ncbi:MAG: hypothetical protein K1X86_04565 [Ignavibacteria bacterium]|nr:hypothetical protein [Ignavibacteria bacterium]